MEIPIQVAVRIQSTRLHHNNRLNPMSNGDSDCNVINNRSSCKFVSVTKQIQSNETSLVCVESTLSGADVIKVGKNTYSVGHVIKSDTSQNHIYQQSVFPLISLFLEGFDASVVTYGQKATGKTYTLYGNGFEYIYSETDQGVVQHCVRDIFNHVNRSTDRTFVVHVGFVEICNDHIRDLLGVGNVHCSNVEEVFHWLQVGLSLMQKSSTAVHTLFTLTLEQQWVSKDGFLQHRLSTASFSDLCASQRWRNSRPGDTGEERNIPYSRSTLTTLLKDSFGGRAQTLFILCISPLEQDIDETLGNLQFATEVQSVRNYVIMNTFSDDNMPISPEVAPFSATSSVISCVVPPKAGHFGLQFAASQWFKLVSNAEGLFSKLITSNALSELEKEQIEEWMFLKQECEDCLESFNCNIRVQKPLVPIQEADELDISVQQDSDNETDTESRPDLVEKLDNIMDEFCLKTDTLIEAKHTEFLIKQPKAVMESQESFTKKKCDEREFTVGCRRRSIKPGTSLSSTELAMLSRMASKEIETTKDHFTKEYQRSFINDLPSACESIRIFSHAGSEYIEKKLRKVKAAIDVHQCQLKEIEQTMQLQKNYISEVLKNRETRIHAKQRFHKKKAKLELELENTKKQMTKALVQGKEKCEIDRLRAVISHLSLRLEDLSSMKHIAGDSEEKLKKLQQSVSESRKQMEELQNKINKERKQREQLEYQIKTTREPHIMLDRAEAINGLATMSLTKQLNNEELQTVQDRLTHLDHILREKSENLQRDEQEETLRHEIRNLRRTRDHLVEQRCSLDNKLKRDKILTDFEERKLLECDEAIEAIDAAIEFKNEIICGHRSIDISAWHNREQGEQMLMERLNKLSLEEMRTLLYKYFIKVIDLKDSSRKLEKQLNHLERERDVWEQKERLLSNAVLQARLEGKRNVIFLQRQYEMKLTLFMRHLSEEASASSTSFNKSIGVDEDMPIVLGSVQKPPYSTQNLQLILNAPTAEVNNDSRCVPKIATRYASTMSATTAFVHPSCSPIEPTTTFAKVTRRKNKIIIQDASRKINEKAPAGLSNNRI
ncbi:kinesin-like protein costa isoform X2 [Scaptodrosophila lebanonensis]|uniref:Kinesin-like protein costa isoform X2 n=1 Tax=Drosophila lebanonensis TaxID=7225 RepID=A0A6J2U3L4_DROLE|nr:kinesin-like protein costa isoform X2 [Scaptodrosophila lebanonensis]